MRLQYIIFFVVVISLFLASWYYVLCFCSTFIYSNKSWLYGVLISIFIEYCLIMMIIPIIKVFVRRLYAKHQNCFFKFMYTIINIV